MKKIFILLILLFFCWLMSSRIEGLYHKVFSSPEDTLAAQLSGRGCAYQHDCKFDWEHYSGYNIRNADLECPMMAAKCVLRLNLKSEKVLRTIEEVVEAHPAEFDTGDGVIEFKACLLGVLSYIKNGNLEKINRSSAPPACYT